VQGFFAKFGDEGQKNPGTEIHGLLQLASPKFYSGCNASKLATENLEDNGYVRQ